MAIVIAAVLALTLVYVGAMLLAGAEVSAEPAPAGAGSPAAKHCKTVTPHVWNRYVRKLDRLTGRRHHKATRKVCKSKLRELKRKIARVQYRLTTDPRFAIRRAFDDAGIKWRTGEGLRVAYCESTLNRFATNGQYAGLFQLSAAHQARMKGNVFNAYDNARHAANTVRADGGWGQWECKP